MTSSPSSSDHTLADRVMALLWRKPAATLAEQTRRKTVFHLIPFLFFLYILAYLDRINVSVAQLGMKKPPEEGGLGFGVDVIGFGAGIFFWGYWILEIPSTVSVLKWGARWVFVRILILWGLACTFIGAIGTPLAHDYLFGWLPTLPENAWLVGSIGRFCNGLPTNAEHQFYVLRFLLGFFEGGFFPSVIVYLSLWFRPQDRAKAIAAFMAAIPLSSVIGSPLSGQILKIHWLGLDGWRWIFILQGVVPMLAGFLTIFFLPDRPEKARWLKPEERDWLINELHQEHLAKQGEEQGHWAWLRHAGPVLLLTLYYFCMNVTSYGLSTFMPPIFKQLSGWGDVGASWLAAAPFAVAFVAMLFNGWHSDKTQERIRHAALPLIGLGGGIFLVAGLYGLPWLAIGVFILLVGACMYAHLPAYWPIPTIFLGGTAAASAVGFINMIGNLGGSVGQITVGAMAEQRKGQSDQYQAPLIVLAIFPFISASIIFLIGYLRRDQLRPGVSPPLEVVESATSIPNPLE